jgi:hypothetical protein
MKDYDLTWLYGPLMPGPRALGEESYSSTRQGRRMSRAEIARHSKKPILKKRSPSEIMLRQSIFSSLLLKQAVASKLGKESSQLPYPIETPTRSDTNTPSSKSTDGLATPDGWKKVQFHELVEQCIVLANAGDEEHEYHYNCDSDDDVIPMWEAKKRATNKWLLAVKPKILPQAAKTIEKLPNAPLKDDEALEDTTEEESIEGTSSPTSISNKSVLLSHDSDEEDDIDWQPPAWLQGRKDSVQIMKDRLANFNMQQDDRAKENTVSHRAYVERRDAGKVEDELPHAPMALSSQGSDALIRFEPAPTRSQLTSFSFSTSKDQFPREDYFIVDPGMTEGESEDSSDMIRSSSHSSESSDKSDSPGLALDNFQQTLLDRVMAEFWRLFYQQRETYLSQSTDSSPPSPTGLTSVPPLMRGRHKSGLPHSRQQQQRGADKLKPCKCLNQ